ncbi:hypothetical protein ACFWAY_51800 [Rhodococcus sp. NPDC059968]|uniref:hypothetical protein n=1 Tax=Rhodococcus sp. NPDC059968 TaxID=3347017 RepID=UPI00366DAB19
MDERLRVATELYDATNQILFTVSLAAKDMHATLAPEGHPTSLHAASIVQSVEAASACLREAMRNILHELPEIPDVVSRYAREFTDRTGVLADVITRGTPRSINENGQRAVFAAIRHGLHQVEHHSGAAAALIVLDYRPSSLEVSVLHDGSTTEIALGSGGKSPEPATEASDELDFREACIRVLISDPASAEDLTVHPDH